MSLSDACCGAALLPHSTYGEWFNLNRLHFPLRAPSTRVLALLRREAVGRQLEVATPRQGAAPGCCTTARVYRRDPAAPRTDVCQEEAGRETSFLFYSNCHPAPVTATAKCFQLPHEMAQCNLLPSPPPRHRDELRQVPSLPPSLLLSRGVGAPACHPCHGPPAPAPHGFSSSPAPLAEGAAASCVRSCPARCPVPGARCPAPWPRAPRARPRQPLSPGPAAWDRRALFQPSKNPQLGSLLPPICPSLFSLFSVYELGEY